MAGEEDECDSSSLLTVASQSDVTAFLHAQSAKITSLHANDSESDDDQSSMDGRLFASLTQNRPTVTKSCLSRSCFASISTATASSQELHALDDLTELQWLSTFKLREAKRDVTQATLRPNSSMDDSISKLSTELKAYDSEQTNVESVSEGVLVFLALHSQHDDKQSPWSLTMEEVYEYLQKHVKGIVNKRGWKNRIKQTLNTVPCFVKMKHNTFRSRSVWTVDPYYRPLLTKAYLSRSSSAESKMISRPSECTVNSFPPKATVKSKALPRLYERLYAKKSEKKDEAEEAPISKVKEQPSPISGKKRSYSTSSINPRQAIKNNDINHLSSSSSYLSKTSKRRKLPDRYQPDVETKALTANKQTTAVTPWPSKDHMYLEKTKKSPSKTSELTTAEEDECDSGSLIPSTRVQGPILRSMTAELVHRRKSSPPKKRSSLDFSSRRANTRISRKVIEEDLQLLRQAKIESSLVAPAAEDELDVSRDRD